MGSKPDKDTCDHTWKDAGTTATSTHIVKRRECSKGCGAFELDYIKKDRPR